jgi:hypothetical protein
MFRLASRREPAAAEEPRDECPDIDAAGPADAVGPVPASERRSTPRRDSPLVPALRAEFALLGRPRSFNIDDVSPGGLGLRGAVDEGRGIFVGQQLARVQLVLGAHEALAVDLEVRSRRHFRSFLVGEQVHIGCRLTGLGSEAQAELKRLIDRLAGVRSAVSERR